MKRLLATLLTVFLLVRRPAAGGAGEGQGPCATAMPVWTEETVKQYALDFIHGNEWSAFSGITTCRFRRYMPMDTYTGMLTNNE
jgi:hypothetical protein